MHIIDFENMKHLNYTRKALNAKIIKLMLPDETSLNKCSIDVTFKTLLENFLISMVLFRKILIPISSKNEIHQILHS